MSAQIVQRFGQQSPRTDRDQQDVKPSIGKRTTIMRSYENICRNRRSPGCPRPLLARRRQGRHRHLRLDRLRAAHARQGGRHLQEERPRRDDQEDPAEGPPPRHRLGRRPVRGDHGRDLDRAGTPNGVATTQIFQLDKSYGADGMVVRNDIASIKDLKGKTVAASAPGTVALFRAGLDAEEERPVGRRT